jgi:hypothetical protein
VFSKPNGPLWFFPGSCGKDVLRQCTLPSGKAILFPILNSECFFAEFPSLKNEGQLRLCAKKIQDSVMQLKASVDGENITNLEGYRIQSPLFNFTLPDNNIVGLPPQKHPSSIRRQLGVFETAFRRQTCNFLLGRIEKRLY